MTAPEQLSTPLPDFEEFLMNLHTFELTIVGTNTTNSETWEVTTNPVNASTLNTRILERIPEILEPALHHGAIVMHSSDERATLNGIKRSQETAARTLFEPVARRYFKAIRRLPKPWAYYRYARELVAQSRKRLGHNTDILSDDLSRMRIEIACVDCMHKAGIAVIEEDGMRVVHLPIERNHIPIPGICRCSQLECDVLHPLLEKLADAFRDMMLAIAKEPAPANEQLPIGAVLQ